MVKLPLLRKREEDYEEIKPTTSTRIVKVDRKKKFPPKPWGKKERYLVGLFFLATILASFAFSIYGRGFKLPSFQKSAVLNFSEQKIIIEKDETRETNIAKTKMVFAEKTSKLRGTWAFSVYNLLFNSGYGLREEEEFTAASLIKLPVMVALFKAAEEGRIDLETKYILREEDKIDGSGALSFTKAGTVYTYRDLARAMGKQSDNTAFSVVRRILGDEKIEAVIAELGMDRTSFKKNSTTPSDVRILLRKIWEGSYLTPDSSQEILSFITDTIYDDRIPAGVPKGIRVAHKVGNEIGVISDAGIIYGPNPFILVIMNRGVNEEEAKENFSDLVKIFWETEM